jgi:hypothetical protein
MENLILTKTGASIINFFAMTMFFSASKKIYLHYNIDGVFLSFNILFLLLQLLVLGLVFAYYKLQGSIGYACLGLRVRIRGSDYLKPKNYIIRSFGFWIFQLALFGGTIDKGGKTRMLIYSCIAFLGLIFILMNWLSIYFMKGRSLIDVISKTEVVSRGK